MPYTFSNRGAVVLVRWGAPVMSDVEACLEDVRRCRREVGPVVLVLFVPEGAPAPPSDVSGAMVRRFPELAAQCRLIFQVFEGSGFLIGFKRSVLTGMLIAANKIAPQARRLALSVHGTFEEVGASLTPTERRALFALVAGDAVIEDASEGAGADATENSRPPLNRTRSRAVTGG